MCAFYQLMNNMRLRFKQYWLLYLLCFFCTTKVAYAVAANIPVADAAFVRATIVQADELQLAQHEVWLALLHYKRETISRRFISQADDARFFLAENGNTDAHAELVADIEAFLQTETSTSLKNINAQCLFPARWWWLKQQLALPDDYDVACPKLAAFMEKLSHHKLFLVFPSMYMNNPGSTFGHTFLRFDGDDKSILLSQTLNYAARSDKTDALLSYIGKGLFGGYTGFFRVRPYSETVQEYSNIENRDIWEYQLDFTAEEIEQLVRHVWEVKGIDFDYYFFRENCSYRLLALIDVVRPGLQLTGENDFPAYAIPVDTVRALDEKNLIVSRTFRASLVTKIDEYFYGASAIEADLVKTIVSDKIASDKMVINRWLQVLNSDAGRIAVLQKSYEVLQFNGQADSKKAQIILQLRNELASLTETEETTPLEKRISPEKGHDSVRVATGYGEQNSRQYIDLRFRPAFHDLLDAPQGYVDGAAINVFDTRFKWFVNNDSSNNLRLESLSLFNVTSISPLQRWRKPLSWKLDFRFDRTQMSQTQSVRNFISRGGIGFSFRWQTLTPFALVTGEWNLSSRYDKGYSLLLGLQAGVRYNYKTSQLMVSYEVDDAVAGFDLGKKITRFQWQYNLQVNHALRAIYRRTEYDFFNDEDWVLDYNYYF